MNFQLAPVESLKEDLTGFLFVHVLLAFPISQGFMVFGKKDICVSICHCVIHSLALELFSSMQNLNEALCKFFVLGLLFTATFATGRAVPQLDFSGLGRYP